MTWNRRATDLPIMFRLRCNSLPAAREPAARMVPHPSQKESVGNGSQPRSPSGCKCHRRSGRAVSGAGLQILRVVTVVPGPIHWYPLG